MTSEDVDQLVESTRAAMVTALEAISRPGPSHRTNIKLAPEDLQTPLAELPRQLGEPAEGTRRRDRKQEVSDETESGLEGGGELRKVESRGGETTDDEMDDDAVLLKRPKGE
jgi:lysophosphatidate acyltransferase